MATLTLDLPGSLSLYKSTLAKAKEICPAGRARRLPDKEVHVAELPTHESGTADCASRLHAHFQEKFEPFCQYFATGHPPTEAHQLRLGKFALLFTSGLDIATRQQAWFAARTHDIGKRAMEHLLDAPRILEKAERDIVATHAAIGGRILRRFAEEHSGQNADTVAGHTPADLQHLFGQSAFLATYHHDYRRYRQCGQWPASDGLLPFFQVLDSVDGATDSLQNRPYLTARLQREGVAEEHHGTLRYNLGALTRTILRFYPEPLWHTPLPVVGWLPCDVIQYVVAWKNIPLAEPAA